MPNEPITSYIDLIRQIEQLKASKIQQETDLKLQFKKMAESLQPVAIIKRSLYELANNKETPTYLVKVLLLLGVDWVADRFVSKTDNTQSPWPSLLIEKLTGILTAIGAGMFQKSTSNTETNATN